MTKDKTDALGQRMKSYEFRETDRALFQTLPIIVRIDGRSFSKFTKGFDRPFDVRMSKCMVDTVKVLVEHTHALIGYCQSDEISLLFKAPEHGKSIFFEGKVLKMTSVLASLATVAFNNALDVHFDNASELKRKLPHFDSRVINLPDETEASNAFLWRVNDCFKNSVSMAAHSLFSHKSLQGMSGPEMQEHMFQEKGINFKHDYPWMFRRGVWVKRVTTEREFTEEELARIPEKHRPAVGATVMRSKVEEFDMPPFNRVTNRNDVLFRGADPIVLSDV